MAVSKFVQRETGRRDSSAQDASTLAPRGGRISVLASDAARAAIIEHALGEAPLAKTIVAEEPREALVTAGWQEADAVILAWPEAGPSLSLAVSTLLQEKSRAVVVFVDRSTQEAAREVIRLGASAFVVDGLSADRVRPVLEVALERHALFSALLDELSKSREELAARKKIERAKGLLMSRNKLTEQAAYDSMRRLAMAQGKPLREIAETILSVSTLFPEA